MAGQAFRLSRGAQERPGSGMMLKYAPLAHQLRGAGAPPAVEYC